MFTLSLLSICILYAASPSSGHDDVRCLTEIPCSKVCQNEDHTKYCIEQSKFCSCGERECRNYNGTCVETCVDTTVKVVYGFNQSRSHSCSKSCVDTCVPTTCDIERCGKCLPGYFGKNCSTRCHDNCVNGCEEESGVCKECVPGFHGSECKLSCPENCLDGSCSMDTGQCRACKTGFMGGKCSIKCRGASYGDYCRYTCRLGCKFNKCDHETGRCLRGCKPGYFGEFCNILCPNGTYGDSCLTHCPATCLPGTVCNHATGACSNGCTEGYEGETCDKMCNAGKHGKNCFGNCSINCFLQLCNPFSGMCDACVRDRSGPHCDIETGHLKLSAKQSLPKLTLNKVFSLIVGLLALGISMWCIVGCSTYYRNKLTLEEVQRTGKIPKRWQYIPRIRGRFTVPAYQRKGVKGKRKRKSKRKRKAIYSEPKINHFKRASFEAKMKRKFPKSLFGFKKKIILSTVTSTSEVSTAKDRLKLPDIKSMSTNENRIIAKERVERRASSWVEDEINSTEIKNEKCISHNKAKSVDSTRINTKKIESMSHDKDEPVVTSDSKIEQIKTPYTQLSLGGGRVCADKPKTSFNEKLDHGAGSRANFTSCDSESDSKELTGAIGFSRTTQSSRPVQRTRVSTTSRSSSGQTGSSTYDSNRDRTSTLDRTSSSGYSTSQISLSLSSSNAKRRRPYSKYSAGSRRQSLDTTYEDDTSTATMSTGDTRMSSCRDSRMSSCRDTRMSSCRDSRMTSCRDTRMSSCRDSRMSSITDSQMTSCTTLLSYDERTMPSLSDASPSTTVYSKDRKHTKLKGGHWIEKSGKRVTKNGVIV